MAAPGSSQSLGTDDVEKLHSNRELSLPPHATSVSTVGWSESNVPAGTTAAPVEGEEFDTVHY